MKMLFSRGAPKQLSLIKPFELDEYVRGFTAQSETGLRPKRITKDSQIEHYKKVLKAPGASPYVYIIGSEPSDKKAKMVAATLVLKFLEQNPGDSRGIVWHTLTGSYRDKYRDTVFHGEKKPKLMVLSNITPESTEVKIEKLRDLLELYPDIPRIVLITGINPLTFCNDYIRYHLNYLTWIYSERKKNVLEVD